METDLYRLSEGDMVYNSLTEKYLNVRFVVRKDKYGLRLSDDKWYTRDGVCEGGNTDRIIFPSRKDYLDIISLNSTNDLSKVKVGDYVYHYLCDKMVRVVSITNDNFPIGLEGEGWYSREGRLGSEDVNPVVFISRENCKLYFENLFKKKDPTINPFEPVLVRNCITDKWTADMFLKKVNGSYDCLIGIWNECIPFKGNEHLL